MDVVHFLELKRDLQLSGRKPSKKNTSNEKQTFNLGSRLCELRLSHGITQGTLAKRLGSTQTNLSHREQQSDMLISKLIEHIEELGGKLHITAIFPDKPPFSLTKSDLLNAQTEVTVKAREQTNKDQLSFPDMLQAEPLAPQNDVIFSIHPEHADNILDGVKTVELRRRFNDKIRPGTLALIYSTSPTRALTGVATIREVQRLPLEELWKNHKKAACVPKPYFDIYFEGRTEGYAIILDKPRRLKTPYSLAVLREICNFKPPQSYMYATPSIKKLIGESLG